MPDNPSKRKHVQLSRQPGYRLIHALVNVVFSGFLADLCKKLGKWCEKRGF